jgi:hypothetical protein
MVQMRNFLHPRILLLKRMEKNQVGMVGYQILQHQGLVLEHDW